MVSSSPRSYRPSSIPCLDLARLPQVGEGGGGEGVGWGRKGGREGVLWRGRGCFKTAGEGGCFGELGEGGEGGALENWGVGGRGCPCAGVYKGGGGGGKGAGRGAAVTLWNRLCWQCGAGGIDPPWAVPPWPPSAREEKTDAAASTEWCPGPPAKGAVLPNCRSYRSSLAGPVLTQLAPTTFFFTRRFTSTEPCGLFVGYWGRGRPPQSVAHLIPCGFLIYPVRISCLSSAASLFILCGFLVYPVWLPYLFCAASLFGVCWVVKRTVNLIDGRCPLKLWCTA